MILAVAYVSLPWWAPTDLIRRHLINQMSSQLGLDVQIGDISMSWDEGIELRDIRIASPKGFSSGAGSTMLSAAVIRAELSPINFFWRRRITWMEIDRPVLNVEVDAKGNVNASVLSRLKFDAKTDRTSIKEAVVNILLPKHRQRLVVGVQDMQVIAGRTKHIGRITMSAELRQDESMAPVALSIDTVQDATPVSATAFFNFAHVDMAQLNLVEILGLPLRKLSGRCSGSLNLQANDDGEIDHVRFNLTVRKLDLQPLDTRIKLPVIPKAGFRVSASYDLVDGCVKLQPFSVLLPGLDMSGTGTLFPEALAGKWQGIRRLEMDGEIDPTQLAAMLTGTNKLPADLGVSGPLRIEMKLDHKDKENVLEFSGTLDGTSAEFKHGDRTIKPPKRKFRAELQTTLDERTFGLNVSNWRVWLGDNAFTGKGTVRDVRKLFDSGPDGPPAAWDVLANWQWDGHAELRDLDSLRSLAPQIERALDGVELSGRAVGEISVDSREGLIAQGYLNLPKGTALSRAGRVLKNADQAVRLAGRASANRKSAGLDDVELRLTVGKGRIVLDRGRVRFLGADPKTRTSAQVDISGDFETARVEHILTGLQPGGIPDVKIRGSMNGKYVIRLSPEAHRLHLAVSDTDALEFQVGKIFTKPSGVKAAASLDFISDHQMPKGLRNTVRCSWREQYADIRAQVSFVSGDAGPEAAGSFRADIRDARWLARSLPAVAEALGPGKLTGAMGLEASCDWSPGSLQGEVNFDADALGYESGGRIGRRKQAGVPLQIRLAGALSTSDDTRLSASLRDIKIVFGDSRVKLVGEADLVAKTPKIVSVGSWPEVMPRCLLILEGRLAVDETLTDLVPELRSEVKRLGLGGYGDFTASLGATDSGVGLKLHIDADNASFGFGREFVKSAGLSSGATVRVDIPADLSKFRVSDLQAHVGDLHMLAGGSARPVRVGGQWRLNPDKLHITAWTRRAQTLSQIAPRLKPYKISGDAIVEAEWVGGLDGRAPYVSFHSESLGGVWRGKNVSINGDLLVNNITRDARGRWIAQGIRTRNLQMRAGKNNVWLLADLKGLDTSPSGSFTVLGRHIDTRDLRQWFADRGPTTRPAAQPATGPADLATGDASKKSDPHAKIRRSAENFIASALPVIRASDVKGSVKIAHLRLWDGQISQYYDLRDMKLDASINHGLIESTYACGLNAGSVRGGVKINLKNDPPEGEEVTADIWQDVRDVAARENIQPQLALFFPGNTVYGQFNRRQDVKLSLRDLVASSLDPSMSVYPVGTAKTVTIDGMTQGRAAPTFVTALFPGLNMTSYRYLKMTAFSELQADGGAYSDMIFSGKTYDMYIEGTTGADKIGRYEIGLILLGTPQTPEWNHIWRQGRLPILKFKARIEDGKMHDVEVSYPWPNESLGVIFVKNNILYRAFLATQGK
jgi:hypothetical protein